MPAPSDYIDVAQRIADFREKHPEGSLRPLDPAKPYTIETIGDQTYIVVVAVAYRSPEDTIPGVGMAYELFPGKTNFTRGSELQNAETSAWGRAIVASLAGDTKKGIASAEEVRNRQAESNLPVSPPPTQGDETVFITLLDQVKQAMSTKELEAASVKVKENVKRLSVQQTRALQQAWKEANTILVVERLDGRIQALAQKGDATRGDYGEVLADIESSKLSAEIQQDLVSQLDEAFSGASKVLEPML